LTEDDEVELENILIMGEGVCLESISDVNDEREEIAEEDAEDEESMIGFDSDWLMTINQNPYRKKRIFYVNLCKFTHKFIS
jgi:hypothetical protein